MKIRNKIVATFFLVVFTFIFFLIAFLVLQKRQMNILKESTIDNQKHVISAIISVKRSMLENTVYDYTYWDDMYNFAQDPDDEWANENIDSMEESFDFKISWVYNRQREIVYHFDAIHKTFSVGDILPAEIFDILDNNKFLYFYLVGGDRILELSAATIHPSHDVERATPHNGYFIVGRLWDEDYLAELSELTHTKIEIVGPHYQETISDPDRISTYYPITDWQERILGEIRFTRDYDIFSYFQTLSLLITILIVALLFSLGGVLFVTINLWVGKPLAKISSSLAHKKPQEISDLKKIDNEFGEIAQLIDEFFEQTKQLELEIEERKTAEQAAKEAKSQQEAMLEAVPDLMYLYDKNGTILDFHAPEFLPRKGEKKNLISQNINKIYPAEVVEELLYTIRKCLHSKRTEKIQYQTETAGTVVSYYEARMAPVGDDKVISIVRDISDSKLHEERLKKINQIFLNFSADIDENIQSLTELCGELLAADCALYNKLEDNLLYGKALWQVAEDYEPVSTPDGHICYDLILTDSDKTHYINHLQDSKYAHTDPNIRKYELQTYIGRAVKLKGENVGSLCVLFQRDVEFTEEIDRLVGIIAAAISVEEERKHAEKKLKRSLTEKEILLREVHHRVKNNMQVITSLMKLQSAKTDNPEIIEQFDQLRMRVRSMAMVHERLYKTKDFSDIDFKEYIHDLVHNLYRSHVIEAKNIEIEYDIDEMHLSLNKAIPCGLIINELVTNSFKHAFKDAKSGKISIILKKADGLIRLEINDSGKGLPADYDLEKSDSLGLKLVDILSQQLEGKFSWSQNEVISFLVEFPAV